jgi:peroxiredoxin
VTLDDFAGMPGYTVSQRAVFIVDEAGDVMWKWVADSPGEEPDYDAVLAALQ